MWAKNNTPSTGLKLAVDGAVLGTAGTAVQNPLTNFQFGKPSADNYGVNFYFDDFELWEGGAPKVNWFPAAARLNAAALGGPGRNA